MGLGLSTEDSLATKPIITVRGRFYRLLDTIGQGAEATVYRCEDQNAAQYAVKVFYYSRYSPKDVPPRVDNFKKEARMLKYLSQRSRHFIFLFDYEYKRHENIGYMIMELGDGSLRRHLVGVPLSDELRKFYWQQIVTILTELQDAHVVHADIKPDNMVMVNDVIKVTDLGLAFRMNSPTQTTRRKGIRGTLDYMAPEVFAHRTGFKSDIWSAGIILYEMTYGRPPYFDISDRNQKITAISSRVPISFPPLRDRHLFDCLRRCLHSDLHRRPDAYKLQEHPYTKM